MHYASYSVSDRWTCTGLPHVFCPDQRLGNWLSHPQRRTDCRGFWFHQRAAAILEQEHPEYLAVAFDIGRTFRDDLFAEYKGTREKMPDDLQIQMKRIRQLVDAFNIPRLEVERLRGG